jgi:hypothetical protein
VIAAVVAVVANLIVYAVAVALTNVSSFALLNPVSISGALTVATIGATIVYALFGRFTNRPVTIFRVVSAVLALLSLASPLMVASGNLPPMPMATGPLVVTNGEVITMLVMHIVAAVAIVGVLTTIGRER